jgi:hypothetical protein
MSHESETPNANPASRHSPNVFDLGIFDLSVFDLAVFGLVSTLRPSTVDERGGLNQ